ncbi:MAG: hypothetical protein IKM31_00205 [Oscillospiraceae bacterium]|nr:hypothetical protein [Oscillospiraceae bacterium]
MKLTETLFRRRFSINFYRNLTLKMGEMSFFKDWVGDDRGDPYPLMAGKADETVGQGIYTVRNGSISRMMGAFFPWATYEITLDQPGHAAGFDVQSTAGDLSVILFGGELAIRADGEEHRYPAEYRSGDTLSVTFRTGGVSAYLIRNGISLRIADLSCGIMHRLRKESVFSAAKVLLSVTAGEEPCVISRAEWHMDAGISQADPKPVRYEDGTPIIENGRIFLTVSARSEENMYQFVVSWDYSSCDFRLEGILFFDCGDGYWCGDVASSIIYDRTADVWRIWMCAFSHGHILARGCSDADPRFGINVVDVQLMEPASAGSVLTDFVGFTGDEDPDLILIDGRWHLAIDRAEEDGYHYYHFVSDDPFDGFTFVDRTDTGEKTGGLFVPTGDGIFFCCGSDFHKRAVYDIYPLDDFTARSPILCDYDDGGFRGWGTVMELPCGSRKRRVWITFDRHRGSSYNWSYGDLYVFSSDTFR